MRIAITADHNGVAMKDALATALSAAGHDVDDRRAGADPGIVVDYPALCADVCREVVAGRADRGVVVGGSGQGEHIACNKIRGIRAGLGQDRFGVEISAAHNASNVLVLPAKVIDAAAAVELADVWLTTPFKGGVHQDRIDQIAALERGESLS
jgi:ribose 5-phosphate isomerase B